MSGLRKGKLPGCENVYIVHVGSLRWEKLTPSVSPHLNNNYLTCKALGVRGEQLQSAWGPSHYRQRPGFLQILRPSAPPEAEIH